MNRTSHVSEDNIRPLVGRSVCTVLLDGTYFCGFLQSCGKDEIILNDHFQGFDPLPVREEAAIAKFRQMKHSHQANLLVRPIHSRSIRAAIPLVQVAFVFPEAT